MWDCLLRCTRWFILLSKPLDETLVCDHLSESYRAVLLSGSAYYFAAQVVLLTFNFSLWNKQKVVEKYFHPVL